MEQIEIKSLSNDLVKFCIKLQDKKFRKENKLIFIDGEKTIEGLISDNFEFEYLFVLKNSKYINYKNTKKVVIINNDIFKKISTTKSPVNLAGIIKEPVVDKNIFYKLNKIALLDGIKDAGNLGTIIRSARAFSIDGIILFNQCVDLYNTKTIRATTQNMFKIPIIETSDIEFIKKLKKDKILISTVVNSKKDFCDFKFPDKFILALGSEAEGLSKTIIDESDEKLTIKMDNNVESINLGACASIAFALVKYRN